MTKGPRSQCDTCARLRSPLDDGTPDDVTGPWCAAFPGGIPRRVFRNAVDHRGPVAGDHGLRWLFNGEPFPEWAFPDKDVLRPPTADEEAAGHARRRLVSDYPLDDLTIPPPA